MLVHADRVQEVASAHRVEVLAALEVEIVGAGVGGGVVLQRAALLRAQGDLQCLDDAARDVVLDREYVLDLAVVGLRPQVRIAGGLRSEEHTSELQSLMRISYAVFSLKKKNHTK